MRTFDALRPGSPDCEGDIGCRHHMLVPPKHRFAQCHIHSLIQRCTSLHMHSPVGRCVLILVGTANERRTWLVDLGLVGPRRDGDAGEDVETEESLWDRRAGPALWLST